MMRVIIGYHIEFFFKTRGAGYIRDIYKRELKKFETYSRNGIVKLENFNSISSKDLVNLYRAIKKFNRALIDIKKQNNIDIYYRNLQGKKIELENFDRYLAAKLRNNKLLESSDKKNSMYYLNFSLKLYVKDENLLTLTGSKRIRGKDVLTIWCVLQFSDLF